MAAAAAGPLDDRLNVLWKPVRPTQLATRRTMTILEAPN
jgi:hypothetical protein